MMNRKIELLAPAKTAEIGRLAIDHGADAVYIGASSFGARAAAGNSLEDIAQLVDYAHIFGAKVYVTINTIITDNELDQVEILIKQLYKIGVDALIIQDMALLQLDLPPIAIHASTQMDNRTPQKVRYLQELGIEQVVLARELSLSEIENIAAHTSVTLEAFVHGALCVSYSGQCYVSEAKCGRSANRGACAQYCRLPYDLIDADGTAIVRGKHLLSLKDLNQTAHIEQMITAGISSFKIEGRLKEASYVKNITAHYRAQIDKVLSKHSSWQRTSWGRSDVNFAPNPTKSFNRGFTSYFLKGRADNMASLYTPKSLGEEVGRVKEISRNSFTVAGIVPINNGDGLCFVNAHGVLEGMRVNRSDANRLYPADMPKSIQPKMGLYRNFDHEFEKYLQRPTAIRRIGVDLHLYEISSGFAIECVDEVNNRVVCAFDHLKEVAKTAQYENYVRQFSRMGDTHYILRNFTTKLTQEWFLPTSLLAEWRRTVLDRLAIAARLAYRPSQRKCTIGDLPRYPFSQLSYLGNVANKAARTLLKNSGVEHIDDAFELAHPDNVPLMFTKYCIKYELGACAKQGSKILGKEPLFLIHKDTRLRLHFDCKNCEMQVW